MRIFIVLSIQSILHHDLCMHALKPLRLRHLQNMGFERFSSIFWRRKSFPRIFFLIWCQIRTVRLMTHQLDVLADQKGAGLSRCVRARIVMVNNEFSSLVRFSKTLGKQIVAIKLTVLRHMTSFAEETGDHQLRTAFSTNNFRSLLESYDHIFISFLFLTDLDESFDLARLRTVDYYFVSGSYA